MKEYTIGGRTFVQRPLVLGQLQQIFELFPGLEIPRQATVPAVVYMLTQKNLLARSLAIVLTEKGKKIRDKELDALADFMSEEADYLTTLEVVESFFEQNNPELIFKKVADLGLLLREKIPGLTSSSSSSPEGTSPKETASSGATLFENVGHS